MCVCIYIYIFVFSGLCIIKMVVWLSYLKWYVIWKDILYNLFWKNSNPCMSSSSYSSSYRVLYYTMLARLGYIMQRQSLDVFEQNRHTKLYYAGADRVVIARLYGHIEYYNSCCASTYPIHICGSEKLGGILCYAGWKFAHMLYFVLFIISEKIYTYFLLVTKRDTFNTRVPTRARNGNIWNSLLCQRKYFSGFFFFFATARNYYKILHNITLISCNFMYSIIIKFFFLYGWIVVSSKSNMLVSNIYAYWWLFYLPVVCVCFYEYPFYYWW